LQWTSISTVQKIRTKHIFKKSLSTTTHSLYTNKCIGTQLNPAPQTYPFNLPLVRDPPFILTDPILFKITKCDSNHGNKFWPSFSLEQWRKTEIPDSWNTDTFLLIQKLCSQRSGASWTLWKSELSIWLTIYTTCFRRNLPYLKRMFLGLIYIYIIKDTYNQSWRVMDIMIREKCGLLAVLRTVPV
jgi:hypothetical protein